MQKNSRILIIAAYVFVAVYLLPMYPHAGSANELTRWATAASLIEKGSFEMSWTEPLIGPNVDTAKVGNRIYSNKAPGTAILAAPVYAFVRIFIGPPDASNIRISWFSMRVAISTLPLLLLAIWMYRRRVSEFSLATLLFATPLFLYSLLFFSHVFVAVAVYFAFRLMFDSDLGKPRHLLFAGALSGIAVISEFPAVFSVVVFGIGLSFKSADERMRRMVPFVLGGIPFAIFLLVYNNALFGSPFSMSYAHESFPEWAEVAGQGVFGIGLPSLSNAYLLLLSPSRGLFFSSPILLLAAYAIYRSFERSSVRKMVRLAAIVVCLVFISGHGAAHGGWAFGPRYLIFVVPLLLDPFFENEIEMVPETLKSGLLVLSIAFCVVPALTFPFAPPEFVFPLNEFWMSFMLDEGWFVPNLANLFGFSNGLLLLLPALLMVAAVLILVFRSAGESLKAVAGFVLAAVMFTVYSLVPINGYDGGDFRRASIAERYYKPANRLETFAQGAKNVGDWSELRKVNDTRWMIADTRAFAPDDFPYLPGGEMRGSPTATLKAAVNAEKRGDRSSAETLIANGKEQFPFARCEFSSNLAVLYYQANRKEAALSELESVEQMITPAARSECLRSQFLLGSLYREFGRQADADAAFQRFLSNTTDSSEPEIQNYRRQLLQK